MNLQLDEQPNKQNQINSKSNQIIYKSLHLAFILQTLNLDLIITYLKQLKSTNNHLKNRRPRVEYLDFVRS